METKMYRRRESALFAEVGSDVVALNVEKGHCYGMENVSATVWSLLAEPQSLESICEELVRLYDVSPEQCRSEVASLLIQLRQEGLVEAFNS